MTPSDKSDDDLILAYAQGDTAAFDALYARYQAALFRFVSRLLGAGLSAQVEEVFQDTWLKIIGANTHYRSGAASFKTWAFTIAHNSAMDRLRASGREPKHIDLDAGLEDTGEPLDWLQTQLAPTHPSAEDTAYWRAAARQLASCLAALPTPQRAAFLLHFEEGMGVQELADALQLGFEAAKSRLRYALQKLKACMGSYMDALSPNTKAKT